MTTANRTKLMIGCAVALAAVGALVALSRQDSTPTPSAGAVPSAAPDATSPEDAATAASPEDASPVVERPTPDAARDPLPFERALVASFEVARGVDPRVTPAVVMTKSEIPCDGGSCEVSDAGPRAGGYLVGYASDRGVPRVTGIVLGGASGPRSEPLEIDYRPESTRFAKEAPTDVTRTIESVVPRELTTRQGTLRAKVVLNARDVGSSETVEHCGEADAPPVVNLGADAGSRRVTACHAVHDGRAVVAWTESETSGDGGATVYGVRLSSGERLFADVPGVGAPNGAPRFFLDATTFVRGSFVHSAALVGAGGWTVGFPKAITGAAWAAGTIWVSTGSPAIAAIDITGENPKKTPLSLDGILEANGRGDACKVRERRVLGSFSTGEAASRVVVLETCDKSARVVGYGAKAEIVPPGRPENPEVSNDPSFLPLPGNTISAAFFPLERKPGAGSAEAQQPVLVLYVVKEAATHVLRGLVLRPD
ncbi:MAG: hypothetical protein U0183_13240 [Polyangiaceae bacterium]